MDKKIKKHLDAIAEQLKGSSISFLFLMTGRNEQQHIVKNCADHNAAALMINYIESSPDVDTAFTNIVMNLQDADDESQTLKERLSDKMEEKGMPKIDVVENIANALGNN